MIPVDPILSLAHSMCVSKGVYAVLLGSGVSQPAGIPTGWNVTLDLIRRLARLEKADPTEAPDAWFMSAHAAEPSYSAILESLAPSAAERRSLMQAYFEPDETEREQGLKAPTAAHRAIARLVVSGHIRIIITTNFDRLMEIALSDAGVTPAIISNGDQSEGAAPLVHQRCVVIKLHGDYLDDRIMNTASELAVYDPRMAAKLDQVLDDFGLIISGWSGEWDEALRAAFERCPSRRYTTYWTAIGEPSAKAASLILHRQAQLVRTASADAFFTLLEEKVRSLEEMQTAAPLSVAAAVATIKRYIVEDRHRVRLDDLVREEAVKVAAGADAVIPWSQKPEAPACISVIKNIDTQTEILRALFFHGCRLACGNQEEIFERAFRMMLPTTPWFGSSIYEVWSDIRFYPMMTVLYSGAYGAISGRNFSMLRKLLTMQFRSDAAHHRKFSADLSAFSAMHEFVAKSVKPGIQTPASQHILDLLKPFYVGYIAEPEDLFDELEVWLGLAAADAVCRLGRQRELVPPGRFMWRGNLGGGGRRHPSLTFDQAEQAGPAWAPLAAGWFGGSKSGFEAAKLHFQNQVARMSQYFF